MKMLTISVALAMLVRLSSANAQSDLSLQTQALVIIGTAANSICYDIPLGGQNVGAILNGTLNKVSALSTSGTAQLRNDGYIGMIQSDLPEALLKSQNCKTHVFDALINRLVPTIAVETGLPITRSVHLTPRTTQQPSIDCNKRNEPVEELLCADADLAAWDGRMGQVYRNRREVLSQADRRTLVQSQRDWINMRDATCKVPKAGSWSAMDLAPAKPCILQMTRRRAAELGNYR